MTGAVSIGGSTTESFEINDGLKQRSVLAHIYCLQCPNTLVRDFLRTRSHRKLFKLARLKASTKTREFCIRELLLLLPLHIHNNTPERYANSVNKLQPCLDLKSIQRKL